MSRRRALERHLHRLSELSEIMRSMKNLAMLEQRKILRLASSQSEVLEDLLTVAADFLAFHPEAAPRHPPSAPVYLLIGSQRGFCGGFNEEVLASFQALPSAAGQDAEVLAVGERLCERMSVRSLAMRGLDGASVVDEVDGVLNGVLKTIGEIQHRRGPIALTAIHHSVHGGEVVRTGLLPPFEELPAQQIPYRTPPLMNVAPLSFWADLVEQYLFLKLPEILYASLMAENQRRVDHMTGAVKHLDEKNEELTKKVRTLRSEEITEEIEVILLSAKPTSGGAWKTDRGLF